MTSFSYIPHRHFFFIDRSRWFCYLFSKSCSVYFLHSFCWLFAWLFSSLICFDTMCAFGGIYIIPSDIYIAFLSLISSDPLLILSQIHFLVSNISFVAYFHYPLRFICSSLFYVFCTCTWGDTSFFFIFNLYIFISNLLLRRTTTGDGPWVYTL